MPLYEAFALLRANAARRKLVASLRSLGEQVCDAGGVVTDVTSYGHTRLAYRIKKPEGYHTVATIASLEFAVPPSALPSLDRSLKLNSTVIRHVIRRRKKHESLTELRRRVGLKKGTDTFGQPSRIHRTRSSPTSPDPNQSTRNEAHNTSDSTQLP